jgi:folate-binding protein YgfZ
VEHPAGVHRLANVTAAPPHDPPYRSPLLSLAGAVEADSPDAGVAAHYGDPIKEQRSLAAGRGFVDLSHRAVVRIEGADRLSWLHNLTTQRLDTLPPGTGTEALLLSPQGHVEQHLLLVDDGTATWIHVESDAAPELLTFLASMRFMLRVDVADVSDQFAVVWEPVRSADPSLVTRVDLRADAAAGREVFVPRPALTSVASERGTPTGTWALEALRIEAGRPRFGLDTDHRTIPHELGWIGTAVQLDKGCYRGQETVARVANLGRPPRRLVRLHLDGSARESLPAHGSPILVGGEPVGALTSSAYHHELGPIALGVVKYATDDGPAVVRSGDAEVSATLESVVVRDDSPRPGQAARAAFRR